MATFTEKTAAFLRQFVVKQASLLTLDSFLTKVAAALPMAKRAAFRAIQTELSSGSNLSHAIKVAFPRLSGEQRGALAVNLCKCAADSEYKKRTFESFAVPVKESNKLMREKCSALGADGADKPLLGSMAPPSREQIVRQRMQEATAETSNPNLEAPSPASNQNNSLDGLLSALSHIPSPLQPFATAGRVASRAAPAAGAMLSGGLKGFNATNPEVGRVAQNAASAAGDAASAAGPLISKGLSGSSDAGASGPFAGINPYLLGALGIGGLGLGAYGVSRMMGRKKRRDED